MGYVYINSGHMVLQCSATHRTVIRVHLLGEVCSGGKGNTHHTFSRELLARRVDGTHGERDFSGYCRKVKLQLSRQTPGIVATDAQWEIRNLANRKGY